MKSLRVLWMLCTFLMFAFIANAQEENSSSEETPTVDPNKTRIGIGISLGTNTHRFGDDDYIGYFKSGAMMGIYVPIHFGAKWKFEPELSFNNLSGEANYTDGNYTSSMKSTFNISRYGFGIMRRLQKQQTEIYFGARIGKAFVKEERRSSYHESGYEDSYKDTYKKTDTYFGPVVGGEYFVSPYFSFGGEAQLIYTKLGRPNTDDDFEEFEEDFDYDAHTWDTRAQFFVRWYF